MNRIWAPWRIKYLHQEKIKSCVFCKIFREKNDAKNRIILRTQYCFAVLNTFPYNNGHTMIVANRHVKSLENLNDAELLEMNKTVIKTSRILKDILAPEGFNIGINIGKFAGAGIDKHIHIHLVPRWAGDTNFMPIISGTKIISQSLDELYKKIRIRL